MWNMFAYVFKRQQKTGSDNKDCIQSFSHVD